MSLFTDLSSEMIFPILPTFLADVLGISKFLIGVIEGIAESTSSLLKVFSGYLSDRLKKRKPIVFFGYTLSALTKPLLAFASTWQTILFLRFSDRVGKGIRTSPRDALIADYSTEIVRGRAFGFHRSMDNLGAVLGTLISFLLMSYVVYDPFRTVFLVSALPGVLAVGILIFFVKERKPETHPLEERKGFKDFKWFEGGFKSFLLASGIFTFSNFSYAFFLLRAQDVGVEARFLPLVYLIYNICYLILSYPAGVLSDRIGRREVISIGYLIYLITSLGFAMAKDPYQILGLFALYGIFHAFIEGVSRAFVADLVPSDRRATALGIYHTTIGIVAFPASSFAGWMWDIFGPEFTFYLGSLFALLALTILFFMVKPLPKKG